MGTATTLTDLNTSFATFDCMASRTQENDELDNDAKKFSDVFHDADSGDCQGAVGDANCDSQNLSPAAQNEYSDNVQGEVEYFLDGKHDDWIRDSLMVLGCFSIYLINMSHLNVVSVLFLDLLDRFDTKASTLTAMLSVTGFSYCLSSQVIVNVVMPRVSIRSLLVAASCVLSLSTLAIVAFPTLPVFIVISIIKFIAQGGAFVPAVTVVGRSFNKRKTLAVALSVLGSSVASIVIPPFTRFLNNTYGFSGCFLILSGLEMNAIVAALLVQSHQASNKPNRLLGKLSTPRQQKPTQPQKKKKTPSCLHLLRAVVDTSLLKNYLVILQLVSFSLNNMCLFMPIYLPAHAERTGISQTDAANLMTICGLCDTSARLIFGFIGDKKCVLPSRVIAFASLYMGVVCHFVALFTNFRSLVFMAVSIGLLGLSSVSYNPNLAVELVGVDHMGKMLALSQLVSTVWFSIQYPIHGVMIESTGSFILSYHYVGVSLILGSVCLVCEPLVRKLQRQNEKRTKQLF